jgi:putative cell wall-binding protein
LKTVNTHRKQRWVALAAAAAACATSLVVGGSASAAVTTTVYDGSYAGADRFATAALVNSQVFAAPVGTSTTLTPGGLDTCNVVVANGLGFADGLSGGVYGNRAVLLTNADALPAATATELARLAEDCGSVDIKVVGGETAVSGGVFEALNAYGDVERIFGANRYATSLAVAADYCGVTAATPGSGCSSVVIATGLKAADALAASAFANFEGMPVILNDGDTLRTDVKAFLAANSNMSTAYIAGGISAVPAQVASDLAIQLGLTVERLEGTNRAATAVAVAKKFTTDPSGVILANGGDDSFADALAAGPLASSNEYPILLVNTCSIPAATSAYLNANAGSITNIYVVGGTSAVCADVVTAAKAAATATGAKVVSATLATSDVKNAVYTSANMMSGTVTFTGKTGGSAAGLAGNGWEITLYQTAAVSVSFVSPDPDSSNPKSIAISGPVNAASAASLAAAFNATPLAADFTAAVGFSGNVAAGTASSTTPGTVDSKIVVTFDRDVIFNVGPTWNVYAGPLPGQTTALMLMCAQDGTAQTFTITCDDQTVAPTVPNAEIRFDAGFYTDDDNGIVSPAVTTKLTNA